VPFVDPAAEHLAAGAVLRDDRAKCLLSALTLAQRYGLSKGVEHCQRESMRVCTVPDTRQVALGGWAMFERYTDGARLVVVRAQEESPP
jgi:hypothetical protein